MITRPRTILAALLLAGVAIGPRCAGTSYPKTMTESAAQTAPHPDPMAASASNAAPHPGPLPNEETEKMEMEATHSGPLPTPDPSAKGDPFRSSVRPVLLARCAPCHEPGGKMYARLPFDDPKVVAENSTAMLRRLKGDERAALERWVAGLAAATPAR